MLLLFLFDEIFNRLKQLFEIIHFCSITIHVSRPLQRMLNWSRITWTNKCRKMLTETESIQIILSCMNSWGLFKRPTIWYKLFPKQIKLLKTIFLLWLLLLTVSWDNNIFLKFLQLVLRFLVLLQFLVLPYTVSAA